MDRTLRAGDVTNSSVDRILPEEGTVILTLSDGSDAQLSIYERLPDKLSKGQKLRVFLSNKKENGCWEALYQRALEYDAWETVQVSHNTQIPLLGTLRKRVFNGWEVEIGPLQGFCPEFFIGNNMREVIAGDKISLKVLRYDMNIELLVVVPVEVST